MIGVYAIRNIKNNKVYVGSSINVEKRLKSHFVALKKGVHANSHLQNAWKQYGEDNFESIILEDVEVKDTLRKREQFYIDLYNAADVNYGYNLLNNTNIGLGVAASTEIKHKISVACTGQRNGHYGKKHSETSRKQISDTKKKQGDIKRKIREENWFKEKHCCEVCGKQMLKKYGSGRFCDKTCQNTYVSLKNKQIIHDENWNKKVSLASKGKKFSKEHRRKISENARCRMSNPINNPMYGKHHSEETKKHWSEIRKGIKNSCGFHGKHHSEESRRKISESLKRRRKQNDI